MVAANNDAIVSLELKNAEFQAQIDAQNTDIAALEASIIDLQPVNTALEQQIAENTGNIELLQQQIQDIITQTCPQDYAIGTIYEDGTLQCVEISSGGGGTSGIIIRRATATVLM